MTEIEDGVAKEEEIITVRLPRKDYKIIRQLIDERQTYNNLTASLKAHWIWVVVAGIVASWALWDRIQGSLFGIVK